MTGSIMSGTSEASITVRQARADIRRGLRSGALSISDVLDGDRRDALATLPLFLLVTWRRGWGRDRQRRIGAMAVRDRVNLGVQLGDASQRTLNWLAEVDADSPAYPTKRRRAAA